MLRFSANLSFLFTELPFLDRFAAAADAGFTGVEILFPYEWQARDIARRLRDSGVSLVLFNIWPGDWVRGERGLAAIPGREADFEARVAQALHYADEMGCLRLHAMAGLDSLGANRDTYVHNLRRAAQMAAPHGVEILVEPINRRDMPDYHLSRTDDARSVIEAVGEPNIALQLDLYHRQIEEGGVLDAIRNNADIVRHYQIAGPPDRGEPDAGDLDYAQVFRAIDRTGYGGWIGCEYRPRAGTLAGLGWPQKLGVTLDGA